MPLSFTTAKNCCCHQLASRLNLVSSLMLVFCCAWCSYCCWGTYVVTFSAVALVLTIATPKCRRYQRHRPKFSNALIHFASVVVTRKFFLPGVHANGTKPLDLNISANLNSKIALFIISNRG